MNLEFIISVTTTSIRVEAIASAYLLVTLPGLAYRVGYRRGQVSCLVHHTLVSPMDTRLKMLGKYVITIGPSTDRPTVTFWLTGNDKLVVLQYF